MQSKSSYNACLAARKPSSARDEVQPQFISLLNDEANQYVPKLEPNAKTAGRRKALAEWIVSDNNWLTARVIVNRLWQHHFGRGIVRSSNNFGQLGDTPTHPELLDYLARELIQHDWNLKPIHRLIMTSNTYRMASTDQPLALEQDPRNDLFWRFDARRLSAEELRDSMLTVTSQINYSMGGPSFYPDVSDEVKAGQSVPGKGWGDSPSAEKARRSVYIFIKRSLIPPELSVFDFPETDGTCEARFLTTQAAQSLNLLNGSFSRKCADDLANLTWNGLANERRLLNDEVRIRFLVSEAISKVYQRAFNESDVAIAKQLIETLQRKHGLDDRTCWNMYCLVLLNTNEFLYLD